ncbi:MAG: MFS transporter [Planctomycetes bacterium]|nr:MFS transporter [Planctomycetota bacterium]
MHPVEPVLATPGAVDDRPWWRTLNRYHWFVLVVCSLAWLFDTMDQQLFIVARKPAMIGLLRTTPGDPRIDAYSADATSIFIMGWALGGLIFGVVGDRLGRAKTMMLTILIYSLFTGLSALSVGVWDFAFYRFLTGLGVGGEFAVGVSLVAEALPDRARPHALGWLQASSALGNMMAGLSSIVLGQLIQSSLVDKSSGWRWLFVIGVVPALLVLVIMRRLKEPERWQQTASRETPQHLGSIGDLFRTPRWRHHAIVGMLLAFAGVVGLWGIGFFSPDLIRTVLRPGFEQQGLDPQQIEAKLSLWVGIQSLLQNAGGFFGVYAFTRVTHYTGRKPAFVVGFLLAMLSTAFTFWFLHSIADIFWMIPIMGFCQLMIFGGYAIYFPELFPTRLRSTGTSFCYNVGRFVAAIGPYFLGLLTSQVFKSHGSEAMRYAGVTMCSFFLIGLAALPFAPETRGQPLPE